MSLFDRRGAKHRSRRRSSCHHESLTQLEAQGGGAERVEVSVPALDEDSGHGIHARRVLVSATGECTPVNEDGDSIDGDEDLQDESVVGGAEVTRQRRRQERKLSLPRMSFGKLTESFEDKVVDAFLWLLKQTQGKQIHATKEVLSIYHDSYLYGEVPLTIKVRTALRGWPLRNYLMWTEFLAAMTSVVLYIYTTYKIGAHELHWLRLVQLACGLFFVVDYILHLYSAPVRLYYIFSVKGLVDFVSTLPIILYWSPGKNNGAEILLFLRVLRIMPVITQVAGFTGGAITEQLFILVMYTIGVVFVAAGVLQWVDNKTTPESVKDSKGCGDQGCLTFFDAVYFIVVTITTVGYGDITPNSDWGRLIVICVILGAVIILPVQINRILQLASRRPFGGRFTVRKVVGSRFIIISGNLTYRTVQDFLSEFYHPIHNQDMDAFPLRIVLMAPYKPSFELKTLMTFYRDRVEFIQGTPVKDSDLDRVSAKVATAFYLLADQLAKDPDAEDAAQIVRTLAVHRHCGSQVRVIVELLKPEKAASAIWDDTDQGIEIICLEVIRFKLLARSCQIKGLSTFIVNLFRTGLRVVTPLKGHWMFQYMHGLRQEVFPIILPATFHEEGLTFEQACELVYRRNRVILFGLDIAREEDGEVAREVFLYPKGHIIQATDVGLGIAKDLDTAEEVSNFHSSNHRPCLHWQKLYCVDCLHNRLFPNHFRKTKDSQLLELVQRGSSNKDSDSDFVDLEISNGVALKAVPSSTTTQDPTSSMLMEKQERVRNWGKEEHHDHNNPCEHQIRHGRRLAHAASTGDLGNYCSKNQIDSEIQLRETSIRECHDDDDVEELRKMPKMEKLLDLCHLSTLLPDGQDIINQPHHPRGLISHSLMTQGENHDQSHVHMRGLISYASMGDLPTYLKKLERGDEHESSSPQGASSSSSSSLAGKKGIVKKKHQDDPGPSSSVHSLHKGGEGGGGGGEEEEEGDKKKAWWNNNNLDIHTNNNNNNTKRFVITLEDAINMAMNWPPLQILDKPDPSIIERRRADVYKHLKTSTLNVVRLGHPHILVCIQGKWPSNLFYFVSQLRTPKMPNPPIVILHPNEPSMADWGCVGVFPQIYFVIGSPTYELDLLRAGVLQAEKVVILTQGNSEQPMLEIANDKDHNASSLAFSLDVNNVFIAATVERLLRPIKDQVIVELQEETEIQYLRPRVTFDRRMFDTEMYRRNRVATFQFAPPYMDGKAFCPSTLNFLMFATFYNRQVMAIVEQLVSGGQVLMTDNESNREYSSETTLRQLDQVPVPKAYVGQTFEQLFLGMLRFEGCLALGLYRARGNKGSVSAFVSTNPEPTELLESTDLVYILH
ncbi:hypothetical protein BDL97_05G064000 [Sphagnum fallax]|nr:hypothetical protein BDL97_05G064000 [Sphagnum fallax]